MGGTDLFPPWLKHTHIPKGAVCNGVMYCVRGDVWLMVTRAIVALPILHQTVTQAFVVVESPKQLSIDLSMP